MLQTVLLYSTRARTIGPVFKPVRCFIAAQPSMFTGTLFSTSLRKQSFLWRALQGFTVFTDAGVNIQHRIKEIRQS